MIKLYHSKNEISIDLSGVQNVAAIDIYYSGKMYAESQLPSGWQLSANKKRILCFSLGDSIPELLFNYTGLIKIHGVNIVDRDLINYPVAVIVQEVDYWRNIKGKFDKQGQTWDSLGSLHLRDSGLRATAIVRNNLLTNPDEFFFLDGSPYEGEYHQHMDTQAMTGAEHSEESELIYRKDGKGRIYNPRKKLKSLKGAGSPVESHPPYWFLYPGGD